MGKKKLRAKYTSKGERSNIAKKNLVKNTNVLDKMINKINAFVAGKKVYYTIPNPNPNETNKRFIRVAAAVYHGTENYKKLNERVIMQ